MLETKKSQGGERRGLEVAEKQRLESKLALPLRPGTGVLGKGIRLHANYLQVTSLPVGEIIQYDVVVSPDVPRNMKRRLFTELDSNYRQVEFGGKLMAYDGMASIYSLGTLPKDSYTLAVQIPGRRPGEMRDFQFKIRRVSSVSLEVLRRFLDGKLDYTPYDIITALEVIMRHPMCQGNNVVVGRSIYDGRSMEPIHGAVDVWKGFFFSLRPALGRLLLNVDTSSTAFIAPGDVIQVLRDFLDVPKNEAFDSLHPKERRPVEHFLRAARIEVTHRGESKRRYKVLGLAPDITDETFFEDQSGGKISVTQYFADKYGIKLKYPKLPCLVAGSTQKAIFLPMECCRIPAGQRYMHKLDGVQTSDMIKIANCKPKERMEGAERSTNLLQENSSYMNAFKLQFGQELMTVNGRILAPPRVLYGVQSREPEVVPVQGVWNLREKAVEIGVAVNSWAVLVFGRANEVEVQAFVRELVITCEDTGVKMEQKRPPILFASPQVESSVKNAYSKAQEAAGGARPQFILCILPTDEAALYGDIKRCTDTMVGLPSQCMLMKHIRRPNKQYCANLCLKINSKLGGVNCSLGKQLKFVTERPTMVFGADVTHPGIGENDKPSIAAVVGSMDIKLARYATSVRVQGSRVEIIEEMKGMVKELLQQFVATNKTRPQRILFYRDGVSEGQFAQVLEFELKAFKAACTELDPNYKPTITFILVQKRHHTRFFTTSPQDADRSGNIPAGTVVDTGVTHPNQFDFYLCSHGGIQGTSRPTHYHIVHDENNFNADDLQQLSYHMCFTFARCTRSVSVVTAAYYAHLVAFRARFHFDGNDRSRFNPVKSDLASQMYYI